MLHIFTMKFIRMGIFNFLLQKLIHIIYHKMFTKPYYLNVHTCTLHVFSYYGFRLLSILFSYN